METAIIAASVAGIISLVGLLVNLHIARKTRKASLHQIQFGSAIKEKEETLKELKNYCEEAELFRIQCWSLLGRFDGIEDIKNYPMNIDSLISEFTKFSHKSETLFESWAKIKPEIGEHTLVTLRVMRHESRRHEEAIIKSSRALRNYMSKKGSKEKIDYVVNKLKSELKILLALLDRIINIIIAEKNSILMQMIIEPKT